MRIAMPNSRHPAVIRINITHVRMDSRSFRLDTYMQVETRAQLSAKSTSSSRQNRATKNTTGRCASMLEVRMSKVQNKCPAIQKIEGASAAALRPRILFSNSIPRLRGIVCAIFVDVAPEIMNRYAMA